MTMQLLVSCVNFADSELLGFRDEDLKIRVWGLGFKLTCFRERGLHYGKVRYGLG